MGQRQSIARRNPNGLSWERWQRAAFLGTAPTSTQAYSAAREAWRRGEDPTEWGAAERFAATLGTPQGEPGSGVGGVPPSPQDGPQGEPQGGPQGDPPSPSPQGDQGAPGLADPGGSPRPQGGDARPPLAPVPLEGGPLGGIPPEVQALGPKVERVVALRHDATAAFAQERLAGAALLTHVIATIGDALPALSTRHRVGDDFERAVHLGTTHGKGKTIDVLLLENGKLVATTRLGTDAATPNSVEQIDAVQAMFHIDVDDVVGRLHRLLSAQLEGRTSMRIEQAKERALFLEALVVLLERAAPGTGR